jgi:bifunctional DNA-binding transcriptional regulator/antitoxin component of YhaV-PrlF toxin-antitoxin module
MKTALDRFGRVVVPKEIRDRLGFVLFVKKGWVKSRPGRNYELKSAQT